MKHQFWYSPHVHNYESSVYSAWLVFIPNAGSWKIYFGEKCISAARGKRLNAQSLHIFHPHFTFQRLYTLTFAQYFLPSQWPWQSFIKLQNLKYIFIPSRASIMMKGSRKGTTWYGWLWKRFRPTHTWVAPGFVPVLRYSGTWLLPTG